MISNQNAGDGSFISNTDKEKRKRRAIGLLSDRILEMLPYKPEKDENGFDYESWEMSIDQVEKKLNVRAGSVYEVFHVFECLLLATKIGPKTYRWNGFAQMGPTLSFLQYIAMYCLNLAEEMEEVRKIEIDAVLKESQKHLGGTDAVNIGKVEVQSLPTSLWPGMGDLIGEGMGLSSTLSQSLQQTDLDPKPSKFLKGDADPYFDSKIADLSITGEKAKTTHDSKRKKKGEKKVYENDKTPHILQVIQKFIMLFLVPSRIQQKNQKAISIIFAAKVIHGVNSLPERVLEMRTRRLYDISNILVSISRHCDRIVKEHPALGFKRGDEIFSMKKVRLPNGNSVRRTTIQYQGPEVQPCQIPDIIQLPDYRRDYLFFSVGKAKLGIPERPQYIPRTTTVRLCPVEGDIPRVKPCEGLINLGKMALMDLRKPISHEDIIHLESARRNVSLQALKDRNIVNEAKTAEIDPTELWLGITPGQKFIKECFLGSAVKLENSQSMEASNEQSTINSTKAELEPDDINQKCVQDSLQQNEQQSVIVQNNDGETQVINATRLVVQ